MALHDIVFCYFLLHSIVWYCKVLHAIALVLHNIVLYSMVLHGIALYCLASINHIFLREVTFIYSGTITSFYYDLFFCVTVLYGDGISVPSLQGCPKILRNLIPGAIFWGHFCFANLRNTVSIIIPLCQKCPEELWRYAPTKV